MTDMEAIKAELNAIICECRGCDYAHFAVVNKHCQTIFKLLKEHDALEPEIEVILYKCPKCHKRFLYKKQKYCDQCGQKVKWE